MSQNSTRQATLFLVFTLFEGTLLYLSDKYPGLILAPFDWMLIVLASALGGASIAYFPIGEWIRAPFTKTVPHSCGAGESIEPLYDGALGVPGMLLSCPICAGTWVGMTLLCLWAINPVLGRYTTYAWSIGGMIRPIVRLSEALEWAGRLLWELTGKYNRENKEAKCENKPYTSEGK